MFVNDVRNGGFLFIVKQLLLLVFLTSAFLAKAQLKIGSPVIIAYVGGYNGIILTDNIDAMKLTHINYAFVDIKDNKAWLHNEVTDTVNFRKLNQLKKVNPQLKILISIGGWGWSENFSDAVVSDASRKLFASSAVEIVRQYDLDGIDIDWEYPGLPGEDNVFRQEDKQHYTLMFEVLRDTLDHLEQATKKQYLLTTAVGGFYSFVEHTEMEKVQAYLDYIKIMTYDFKTGEDTISGHHTNLYPSAKGGDEQSADRSVKEFIQAGVPREKIVLGAAFYSRNWKMETRENNGLERRAINAEEGFGYSTIKDSILTMPGFKRYWDKNAKAPYIFNQEAKIFISYDDEKSVKNKCNYIKKNQLAGIMFWEYFADPQGYLLNEINRNLR